MSRSAKRIDDRRNFGRRAAAGFANGLNNRQPRRVPIARPAQRGLLIYFRQSRPAGPGCAVTSISRSLHDADCIGLVRVSLFPVQLGRAAFTISAVLHGFSHLSQGIRSGPLHPSLASQGVLKGAIFSPAHHAPCRLNALFCLVGPPKAALRAYCAESRGGRGG
jgi:hypothetical protein